MATYRRSILWRLACDPVAWIWSGYGDLATPADAYDPAGATYKGAGALLEVPALKALMNGLADRVDFSLSGVSPAVFRLAMGDKETVDGATLHVGYILFDADWQIIGGPVWEWSGVADILITKSDQTATGRQRTISLSVAAADTTRSNAQLAYFTDADQRKLHPTDAIFDHVAGISAGTTRRFGAK